MARVWDRVPDFTGDAGPFTFGGDFTTDTTITVEGVLWWQTANGPASVTAYLWTSDGQTQLATGTNSNLSLGWNLVSFSSSYVAIAGSYSFSIETDNEHGYNVDGLPKTSPDGHVTITQGRFQSDHVGWPETNTWSGLHGIDLEYELGTGSTTHEESTALSAEGTLTAQSQVVVPRQVDFSSSGTLDVSNQVVITPAQANLTSDGLLDATGRIVIPQFADMSSDGVLSAIPRQVLQPDVILDGSSELRVQAAVIHKLATSLSGTGMLTASDFREGGTDVTTGPCGTWEPIWSTELPVEAAAVTGYALQAATEVLYALSGRRFGLCTVTLRPCRRRCLEDAWPLIQNLWWEFGSHYPVPINYRGSWFNIACTSCVSDCSCEHVSEISLPGPVHSITSVKVDGQTLTPDVDYRLDNFRILVRLGDEWPLCNDLNLADTEPGTWSVTAQFGEDVPTLGKMAVGVLAAEFAKLLIRDNTCALPKPVQSIVRQGVNITFLDPNEVFANGRTGLYIPDLFITTYNPNGLTSRAMVYNLDDPVRYTGGMS